MEICNGTSEGKLCFFFPRDNFCLATRNNTAEFPLCHSEEIVPIISITAGRGCHHANAFNIVRKHNIDVLGKCLTSPFNSVCIENTIFIDALPQPHNFHAPSDLMNTPILVLLNKQ